MTSLESHSLNFQRIRLITLDDERDGKSHKFHYEGGIVSFVTHLNKNKSAVNEKPIYNRAPGCSR